VKPLILVTSLTGDKYYLNPGLIEFIEMVPDTLITMSNGRKHLVRESARDVAEAIETCRARIMRRSMDPTDPYGIIEIQEEDPDDAEE
jgi:flagellar protein FlbD